MEKLAVVCTLSVHATPLWIPPSISTSHNGRHAISKICQIFIYQLNVLDVSFNLTLLGHLVIARYCGLHECLF